MKLIDILAREMDEWPAGRVTSVWQLEDGRLIHTFGRRGAQYFTRATDWVTAVVTRRQWEEARRELQEHSHEVKADEWPPKNSMLVDGKTRKVTHIWDGENWAETPHDYYGYGCFVADVLRPAKSDRDRWIEHAQEVSDSNIGWGFSEEVLVSKTIEAIYDAGLGKLKEEDDA